MYRLVGLVVTGQVWYQVLNSATGQLGTWERSFGRKAKLPGGMVD